MNNQIDMISKKHGMVLLVSSVFLFVASLILSKDWVTGYSIMQNIDRIFIFRFGESAQDYFHIYTKYILVLALALGAFATLLLWGAVKSPFHRALTRIIDKVLEL